MKPNTSSRRPAVRLLHAFLLLVPLLTVACDEQPFPPNQWWTVDGYNRPETMTRDGVVWVARQTSAGHWCYYPQSVSNFIDQVNIKEWGDGDAASLIISGRRWTVTTSDHESWRTCPPWNQTEDERNEELAHILEHFVLGLVIVVAIIVGFGAYASGVESGQAQAKSAFTAEVSDDLKSRERAISQRERAIADAAERNKQRQRQIESELQQREREFQRRDTELQQRQSELEAQQQRNLIALKNAEAMLQKPKADSMSVSQYLRNQHLQGAAFGDLVVVTFLADRSGFVRLAWAVQIDRPVPPIVRISRDGKLIRSDAALSGEHGDQIMPGKRYIYRVGLQDDRGHWLGRGLEFELKIPIARVWNDESGGDEPSGSAIS